MNPVFRFLYWNMNYHVEHHMFPMVPYHALPKLHEEMKHGLPHALSEHCRRLSRDHPALLRQRKDPTYFIRRELPAGRVAVGGGITKKPELKPGETP